VPPSVLHVAPTAPAYPSASLGSEHHVWEFPAWSAPAFITAVLAVALRTSCGNDLTMAGTGLAAPNPPTEFGQTVLQK
jgi:hypothetical protein